MTHSEKNNKKGDFKPSVTFTAQNKDGKTFNIDAQAVSNFIETLTPDSFSNFSEHIKDRRTLMLHNWKKDGDLSAFMDILIMLDALECLFLELNFKEKTN